MGVASGLRRFGFHHPNTPASTPVLPRLRLGTAALAFASAEGDVAPAVQAITIWNDGGPGTSGLGIDPNVSVTAYGQSTQGWLAGTQITGGGNAATLTVGVSTAGLVAGTYTATISVIDPIATNGSLTVTVTLVVALSPAATIQPSTTSLTFSATAGGTDPTVQTFTIGSNGLTLAGLTVGTASTASWCTPTLQGTTITVAAALGTLAPAAYSTTFDISSSNAGNSPVTVTVYFTVAAQPVPPALIALSATSRTFAGTVSAASPASQTITISNGASSGTLNPSLNTSGIASWCSASLTGLTITVGATTGALTTGTYTTSFQVTDPTASNSPQTVTVTFTVAPAGVVAELPRVTPDYTTTRATVLAGESGSPTFVPAGSNLQTFLNAAHDGDVLQLDHTGVWVGTYTLPARSGTGWVRITSDAIGSLPAAGTATTSRVHPSDAPSMPRITMPTSKNAGDYALSTQSNAARWWIEGIEFFHTLATDAGNGVTGHTALITLGSPDHLVMVNGFPTFPPLDQTGLEVTDIVLDRCYIHSDAQGVLVRGIALHCESAIIANNYIENCKSAQKDSQAISAYNGGGPYLIHNNFLSGAGENILVGGGTIGTPGKLPRDITVTKNYFYKPASWKGQAAPYNWSIKNSLEFKVGQRILIEGNIFDGGWTGGQKGIPVVAKIGADESWAATSDLTYRHNVIRNCAGAFALSGPEGPYRAVCPPLQRVLVEQNLCYDLNIAPYTGTNVSFFIAPANNGPNPCDTIVVQDNTAITSAAMNEALLFGTQITDTSVTPHVTYNVSVTNLTFQRNISLRGSFGVFGSGFSQGEVSLTNAAPGCTFVDNAFVGADPGRYATSRRMRWTANVTDWYPSFATHDFTPSAALTALSPSAGCDATAVLAATSGVDV